MLKIERNIDLTNYTTLKIGAPAEFFACLKSTEDLLEAIAWSKKNKKQILILGGGSNILISKKVNGLVLKNEIKGLEIVKKDKNNIFIEAKSGESWTRFVNFTLENKAYGLENLFLIYGTVGAAPMQNIGAYGVELKDVFDSLKAVDLKTGREKIFTLADCHFAYRDSIFKNRFRGRYFILSLTVKLTRRPNFKLDYGTIREELNKAGIKKPTAKELIDVIQKIRNSKIPSPAILPNAGSFFKNVEISQSQFKDLKIRYPEIPSFPGLKNRIKIPAAWLIERAGFKGWKYGSVSMYEKQALILVNHGGAKGKDVLNLVKKVKLAVKKAFGLDLVEEVNIL